MELVRRAEAQWAAKVDAEVREVQAARKVMAARVGLKAAPKATAMRVEEVQQEGGRLVAGQEETQGAAKVANLEVRKRVGYPAAMQVPVVVLATASLEVAQEAVGTEYR